MSILIDDSVVALNEVVRACAVSTDTLDWVGVHGDEALRQSAVDAADVRRACSRSLVDAMLAGEMEAKIPDPETTGLDALFSAAKAFVANIGDDADDGAVAAAIVDAESTLADALDHTTRFEYPNAVRRVLDSARDEIAASRITLDRHSD